MSISPVSPLLASPLTAVSAAGAQSAILHSAIGVETLKDEIKLSKEVIALLAAGNSPSK